jgi:uncharacterized coiled-coil protein SlyX
VVTPAQSFVIVQDRVWVPDVEQAFQSVQLQVSAVQEVAGVQDCVVAGLGVVTPAQSFVIVQERIWLPEDEQAFQSVQLQVSAVQAGGGVQLFVEGGVQDCVVAGLGVVAVAQSEVMTQLRVWLPDVEQAFQSVQLQASAVQEGAVPPEIVSAAETSSSA